MDREDIESLSNSLYKIPKMVEKIAERILLAPRYLETVDLSRRGKEFVGSLRKSRN